MSAEIIQFPAPQAAPAPAPTRVRRADAIVKCRVGDVREIQEQLWKSGMALRAAAELLQALYHKEGR